MVPAPVQRSWPACGLALALLGAAPTAWAGGGDPVVAVNSTADSRGLKAHPVLRPLPPLVVATAPPANQVGSPPSTDVWAQFSEAVDPLTVDGATFAVRGSYTGDRGGVHLFPLPDQVDFVPDQLFRPGERVVTTVSSGVQSALGTPAVPFTWEFVAAVRNGDGLFVDSGQLLGASQSFYVALGDLDGDGDLDAFVVNTSGQGNTVWFNDGSGSFTDSGQALGTSNSTCVALGDLDADGDLDAAVVNYSDQASRVWFNGGNGLFVDSGQTLGAGQSAGVGIADVEGDGDLDVVVANAWNQPNQVWLNDGAGGFTDSGQALGTSWSYQPCMGDLDGDGDVDMFVANRDLQPNQVLLNDGTGVFVDTGQALGSWDTRGAALGDVDGDGDLDAVAANWNLAGNRVWLNDGSGTFTDSGQSLGAADSYRVALGDIDGDGDLDAFFTNELAGDQVFLNDGAGTFFDSGQALGASAGRYGALGDLDGDGDLDAFVTNQGQPDQVWLNNSVPVAVPDLYETYWNTTLTVPIPGVLANDTDLDLDSLTVASWSPVSAQGGAVVGNTDGSFAYTPPPGYSGPDTFTYTATDGLVPSNLTTVTVAVRTLLVVTTSDDELNADGDCSLREAVMAANTDSTVDACGAGNGWDTVSLPPGTYSLTISGTDEDDSFTGDLDVTDSLTLTGAGANVTVVDAGGPGGLGDRVLHVDPPVSGIAVEIRGLTVSGGSYTVSGAGAGFGGGGVVNAGASLSISDCVVSGNAVTANALDSGANGGGVYNQAGSLILNGVTVSGNSVTDNGNPDKALVGGGVCVGSGTFATVTNSTVSGNTVTGVGVGSDGYGGGLGIGSTGNSDLAFVTVTGNSVATLDISRGGGVDNANPASVSFTQGSVVAGNTAASANDYGGDAGSFGFNLVQDPIGTSGLTSSDLTGRDPLLGPLQLAGGGTETHAPQWGSSLHDLVNGVGWPPADQRGAARPGGPWADAGSVEDQYPPACGQSGWAMAPLLDEWYLIGLPCDPGPVNVASVFGDDLPLANFGLTWALLRRDATTDSYVMLDPLVDPLDFTQGLWFKTLETPSSGVITVDGSSVQGTVLVPLVDDLAGRFNLVANPFESAYFWPDVLVRYGGSDHTLAQADSDHRMSQTMYRWNGSAYQSYSPDLPSQEGTLFRYDGFWVEVWGPGPVQLVMGGSPTARRSPRATSLDVWEWTVRWVAEEAGRYDPGNLVGQLEGARCERDSLDLAERPPDASPYLTVVFPRPEWGGPEVDLTTDLRPVLRDDPSCPLEWRFEVRTSQLGEPVTLRWSERGQVGVLPTGWLLDEVSGEAVPTTPGGSYTFTPAGEAHRFTFSVDLGQAALIFADGLASGDGSAWSAVVR